MYWITDGVTDMKKLDRAIDRLITLVEAGYEYPDALASVCRFYGIDSDTLRRLYDERN
jgi:hypothetical protein